MFMKGDVWRVIIYEVSMYQYIHEGDIYIYVYPPGNEETYPTSGKGQNIDSKVPANQFP